jgi:hypothetical protein
MSDAEDAYGTKVWVQLEWEQIDAVIVKELKEHIESSARDVQAAKSGISWVHPEDAEYSKSILLPALFVVYEYWAGEEAAEKLKEKVGYED